MDTIDSYKVGIPLVFIYRWIIVGIYKGLDTIDVDVSGVVLYIICYDH
jgi:hypothetical protein